MIVAFSSYRELLAQVHTTGQIEKLFEFNTSVLLWSFLRHFSFRPHLDSYGYQVPGVPQLAQKRPITNSKSQIQTASEKDEKSGVPERG